MKYWNELDTSIFFRKLFSHPVEIDKIALFSLQIQNDQPSLALGFDIPEFPDNLPEKWKNKDFNTCRVGLTCTGISELIMKDIPTKDIFSVKIVKAGSFFAFQATTKNSLINFKAKFISLCGPSVYANGPEDNERFKVRSNSK